MLLFNFKLRHIPGSKHARPDGLSQCQQSPEDMELDEMPEGIEEWLDDVVSCGVCVADTVQQEACYLVLKVVRGRGEAIDDDKAPEVPTKPETLDKFIHLKEIHTFLETLQLPKALSHGKCTGFLQQASRYFVTEGKLCRKQGSGQHQLVVGIEDRLKILCRSHDTLGHKGIYAT